MDGQYRVVEFARQHRAVVMSGASPLQVVHAQAVHQYGNLATGIGQRPPQRRRRQFETPAVQPERHRNRQRIATRFEMVAPGAVDDCERRFALRRQRRFVTERLQKS